MDLAFALPRIWSSVQSDVLETPLFSSHPNGEINLVLFPGHHDGRTLAGAGRGTMAHGS